MEDSYYDRFGRSVVLPCFIDPDLMTEGLKIQWRRSGLKSPVCVYTEGSEVQQHEDYHDRVHFYTDDIKHGNLSLLLKKVSVKDVGEYTCTVNSKQRSVFSFSVNVKKTYGKFTELKRSSVERLVTI